MEPPKEDSANWDYVTVSKRCMNKLIMEFFLANGMKEAVAAFQKEALLDEPADLDKLEKRAEIKTKILNGQSTEATELIRQAHPEVIAAESSSDIQVLFKLKKQIMVEMIRAGNASTALEYAQQELGPLAERSGNLSDLEGLMGLLLFPDPKQSPDSLLLSNTQRMQTATQVNAALLQLDGLSAKPKLSRMLQAINWCEAQLEDRAIYSTTMAEIVSAASGPLGQSSSGMSGSDEGAEDMVIDRPAQKRSAESDATDS